MAIGVQQFQTLSPEQMSPYGGLLQNALKKYGDIVNAKYMDKEKSTALNQAISEALMKQAQAKYAPEMEQAKMQHEQAQAPYMQAETNKMNTMTPLEAIKQSILNKYLPQREKAEIGETTQRGNYYSQGGSRGNLAAGDKGEMFFERMVGQDNPQLKGDPNKIFEASNVLRSGGNTLSDGTKINPLSPASQASYERVFKGTTTAPLVTAGVKANSAAAEMPVLDKYIKQGRSHYGKTIGGISYQQLKDSINSEDPKAAQRIGEYIASDVLSFDKAALQTRIAGTESGVTIINEVMQKAKQTINAKYPRLSDSARQVALETVSKALEEALAARNKYGISASSAVGKRPSEGSSEISKKDELPEGIVEDTKTIGNDKFVKMNGTWYHQ